MAELSVSAFEKFKQSCTPEQRAFLEMLLRPTQIPLEKLVDAGLSHQAERCAGEVCCIHNPSDHHMIDFPQVWRMDRGITERTCPHGVGHPDPDDIRIQNGKDGGIHGCDGCCSPGGFEQLQAGNDA